MNPQIDAIFDNGVFKPLVPLSLPDKSRVKLTVDSQMENGTQVKSNDEWERLLLAFGHDCGISLSDTSVSSEGIYE
jgi:predicted DNA-binding antitoxin AbrB/MazE fold protein